MIALFASLTAALGYFSIPLPFSPVPVSGQTLAIILAGLLLTPRAAGSSIGLWVMMGVIGLPVFSGGRAGFGVLMGPSGGYIIGFIVCAWFIAMFRGKTPNIARFAVISAFGSFVIIYAFGLMGLMVTTGMTLPAAFTAGVVPFLIGDTIKIVAAVAIAIPLHKHAKQYLPSF